MMHPGEVQAIQVGAAPLLTPIKRTTQIAGKGQEAFAAYNRGMRTISMNSATVHPDVVAKFRQAEMALAAFRELQVMERKGGKPTSAV